VSQRHVVNYSAQHEQGDKPNDQTQ
jgi:hypothetical protein